MEQASLSPVSRKNRREALGLLLGAAFITPAAFTQTNQQQKKMQPPKKQRPMVIIIETDPKGGVRIDPTFQHHHLSKAESDRLIVLNLHSGDVLFKIENNPFSPPPQSPSDSPPCYKLAKYSYRLLTINGNPNDGAKYNFCAELSKCPASCPKKVLEESGGDITIDQ